MKYNLFLIYTVMVFWSGWLNAQPIISEQLFSEQLIRLPARPSGASADYEGSPFLVDSFQQGQVVLTSNAKFNLPMRFNIYNELIEVKFKGRDMQLQPNDLISRIELNGHTILSTEYELEDKKKKGFLFLLDSGVVSLLQKRNISFKEWRPAKAQEAAPTPAAFKPSLDQFFIRYANGRVVSLPSVKDLASAFPSHRNVVSDFIKKEKIKLKKDKLLQLFTYYRSLEPAKS